MTPSRCIPLTAALLVLAGCLPAYVSPRREDAASLKLIPKSSIGLSVDGFANGKECRTRLSLTGRESLKEPMDVRVAPEEDFTILAFFSSGNASCKVALTFLPRPRHSYAAVMEGSGFGCGMTILRAEGRGWIPEPSVRKRSWEQPVLSNDEAQCGD
jgi:hypothetical protein